MSTPAKIRPLTAALAGLALLAATAAEAAQTVTFQYKQQPDSSYTNVHDADVYPNHTSSSPDQVRYLELNYRESGQKYIIYFDLASIPQGSQISNARLELNLPTLMSYGNSGSVNIFQTATNWLSGVSWTHPGGDWIDSADQLQGSTPFASIPATFTGWYSFEVTSLVQRWVSGNAPNYGFTVIQSHPDIRVRGWGIRATNSSNFPKLIITYDASSDDTTPPLISNVTHGDITATSASVSWSTNEPATSQVDYGTSLAYGTTTPLNTSMVQSHTVALTELQAGQQYYYRVRSRDAAGNEAVSEGAPFSTASAPGDTNPPSGSILINNGDQAVTQRDVTLALNAHDDEGIVTEMRFANESAAYSSPEPYNTIKNWTLSSGDGLKTVHVKYKDDAGNWSDPISASITLDTTAPTITITSHQDGQIINP